MEQSQLNKNFFLIIKMIYILLVLVGTVLDVTVSRSSSLNIYFLFSALFFASAVIYELLQRKRWLALLGEAISVLISVAFGFKNAIFFGPVVLLDLIILIGLPVYMCLLVFLVLMMISRRMDVDLFRLMTASIAMGILYYQEYGIIAGYKKDIVENNEQESRLKQDIEYAKHRHELQMKQSRLAYENQILTEKANISQALHDKLGHSINGSLYQLEACKVIMKERPEETKKMLQAVIDNLRGSMDEIRLILRRERPDKGQLSMLQLRSLCEECKDKYGIEASIRLEGEDKRVNSSLWEILLDNTYEAVSNALKYAGCKSIKIEVLILNEVVRCTIADDGVGCKEVVDGMGLSGMKQRVRGVHGFLDVDAKDGFKINMILPLEKER